MGFSRFQFLRRRKHIHVEFSPVLAQRPNREFHVCFFVLNEQDPVGPSCI